jgi:signal transduction histidine kinase
MDLITMQARRIGAASEALLLVPDQEELVIRSACGTSMDSLGHRVKISSSFAGKCYSEGKTFYCPDSWEGSDLNSSSPGRIQHRSFVAVPIFKRRKIAGVIQISSFEANAFSSNQIRLFEILAGCSGSALWHLKAERELKRSNQELAQYAALISHDLKEPLRVLTCYLQLAEAQVKEARDKTTIKFLDIAIDAAFRMQGLIEGMLTYCQLERPDDKVGSADANEVLHDVVKSLDVLIKESEAEIVFRNLPKVRIYRTYLALVFQNLICNSIKYRRSESPKIVISASITNEKAEFCVADNGKGIDVKDRDLIFKMFHRSDRTCAGRGIGLATCQKIIEQNGGMIWAESTFDKGSNFYFTVPLA